MTIFRLLIGQKLLLGYAAGLLLYILSAYFQDVSGAQDVSGFFLVAAGVTLFFLLSIHHVIAHIGRARLYLLLLLAIVVIACALIFVADSLLGAGLAIVLLVATTLVVVIFDMLTQSFSTDAADGQMYGAVLSAGNLGFLFGPISAGYIVAHFMMQGIFFMLVVVYSIVLVAGIVGLAHLRRLNHVTQLQGLTLVRHLWRHSWFRRAYALSLVLQFFYAVMIVYMPLLLAAHGFSVQQIGVIFTVILVPFIVVEYPAGVIADKFLGEREMLLGGLVLILGSLAVIVTMPLTTLTAWLAVLFVSRIGAALVESMSDIYFYKHVESEDVGTIGIYRTAYSMGLLAATLCSTIVAWFLPESLVAPFGVTIAVVLGGLGIAWHMRDTQPHPEVV